MPNHFNDAIIDEFRANNGRVGGMFTDSRLLLLTTTGARTGRPHTTPLGYLPDTGDRLLVVASAGGSPRHPAWYHNIRANPIVTVEDGAFTYQAEATVLTGAERDRIFARIVEVAPGYADYQAKATRVIPVVGLTQVAPGPPNASSFGEGLRVVHDAFRLELAAIRREVAESGPGLGAQLRINCLSLCQGLGYHHRMEDDGIFPTLAGQPGTAAVLDRLRVEHKRIAALLAQLQQLLADPAADAARLRAEVDRLTGEVEEHLTYEEEHLIPLMEGPGQG
ncbi:nitroreductase/quinone reductase family protein [Micromonospora inyonensis]|uniref:nitroreductase/quinone reductase family protein n=1 Tax=Micromonospora inyonensis TaxID=47866 RepID=UPI000B83CE11|nr:nitroreductase/quinone reductase family protein [Micromonospora inyonensis]